MKIVDKKLLAQFRLPGFCEICGRWCESREPHHIIPCGAGGGKRLDVPLNLVSVGVSVPFPLCECHGKAQRYEIPQRDLFAIVARRESKPPWMSWTAASVESTVREMMRTPKPNRAAKAKSATMADKVSGHLLSWAMRLIEQIVDEEAARWRREAERFGVRK